MARAGKAKTRLEGGQKIDIKTGLPYVSSRNLMTMEGLSNPKNPVKIPTLPMATETAALGGSLDAMGDAYTRALEARTKERESGAATSFQDLIGALKESEGKGGLELEAYEKAGVNERESELDAVNSDLLTEQQKLKMTQDRLRKNAEGLESSGLEGELERVERESLSKQADLAVKQMAAQGRFDSAKEIADRAVNAQFERQTQRNELLKLIYEENKDLFTTAEAREFEEKQSARERDLDTAKEKEMYRYKAMIDQEYDTEGTGAGFKLTQSQRSELLSGNFTNEDVDNLIADVSAYGIDEVIKDMDEAQKALVRRVFGGTTPESDNPLTRENIATLFGLTDDDQEYDTSWLPFNATTNRKKIDEIEAIFERYRLAGYSDKEILKMLEDQG